MRQKNQVMRYNDTELQAIKNLFADNEDLLFLIRKVLLQFELNQQEVNILKTMSQATLDLLQKTFLPELDCEAPLFQLSDMRVALLADLRQKGIEEMSPLFEAKKLEMDYLKQQFEVLAHPDNHPKPKIILEQLAEIGSNQYKNYVNLTAWNYLITYIDSYTNELRNLAGRKEETVEQTMRRLKKDSAK